VRTLAALKLVTIRHQEVRLKPTSAR
jgi:hypothetical protein